MGGSLTNSAMAELVRKMVTQRDPHGPVGSSGNVRTPSLRSKHSAWVTASDRVALGLPDQTVYPPLSHVLGCCMMRLACPRHSIMGVALPLLGG